MNIASITKINRTKFFMIMTLLVATLSYSALAQNKPLTAKSLTALVAELKDVVSRSTPDKKESALVAQKWNKRKDLAGKTKKDVINLLYQDVKSVVKDSGVQYQIYSMFSMYKQIPDEQFSGQTGTKPTNSSKKEIVEKLVDLVFM